MIRICTAPQTKYEDRLPGALETGKNAAKVLWNALDGIQAARLVCAA
jgi:hypothetical protein